MSDFLFTGLGKGFSALREGQELIDHAEACNFLSPETADLLRGSAVDSAAREARIASLATDVDLAAHAAASSPLNLRDDPTDGQKESGNYKKGHVTISGLNLSIENPQGSTRYSHADVDPPWESTLEDAHYGYLKGVVGQDKDHLDVFLKPGTPADFAGSVYVVHQVDQESDAFDEHKVMLGYADQEEAVAAYAKNYPAGWKVGPVEAMTIPEFKKWTASGSVVQRWWGSGRPVAFVQPAPFLSKGGPGSGRHKEISMEQAEEELKAKHPSVEGTDRKLSSGAVRTLVASGRAYVAHGIVTVGSTHYFLGKGGPGSGRHPGIGSKAPKDMSASEIEKEKARLSVESSKVVDELIAAGRGRETFSETKTRTDPLSMRHVAYAERTRDLHEEKEARRQYHGGSGRIKRKSADIGDLEKDVTTGTGLSTPQAGLTHYDRRGKQPPTAKDADEDVALAVRDVAALRAKRKEQR